MTKRTRLALGVAGVVVALVAAGLWLRASPGQPPANQPPVVTLDAASLQTLRADFNRDLDAVRLIVLLSPT